MSSVRIHRPDVLRGGAACGVVLFHVLYLSGIRVDSFASVVVGRFDYFVRVFFAVGAFSMAYAYNDRLNTLDDIRAFIGSVSFELHRSITL